MAYEITDLPAHLRASAMKQLAAQSGGGVAKDVAKDVAAVVEFATVLKRTAKPKPEPKAEAAAPADFASSGTHKPAHTRHLPGRMNQTEARYGKLLDARIAAGEVAWWIFESMTLRLGPDCRYTPDFLVQLSDGTLQVHETKGFFRDDAKAKVAIMTGMFPFPLFICKWIKKEWEIKQA